MDERDGDRDGDSLLSAVHELGDEGREIQGAWCWYDQWIWRE